MSVHALAILLLYYARPYMYVTGTEVDGRRRPSVGREDGNQAYPLFACYAL